MIHLAELARAYILPHIPGLVDGAQCCVIYSHKVWHHLGERRAKAVLLFVPARHHPCGTGLLWQGVVLCSWKLQSLKIVRKDKKSKSGEKHLMCDKVSDFITDFIT